MTIDLTQPVLDYDKKILRIKKDGEEKDLVLKEVFITALNTQAPGEVPTVEQKIKIFELSTKMFTLDSMSLTVDEAAFIKERVGKIYNPLVYGRICELFDNPVAENALA